MLPYSIRKIWICTFLLLLITLLSGCIENELDIPVTYNNSIGIQFVLIPAGEFNMGSNSTPMVGFDDPLHKVTISKPFYMAKYEVTQEEWTALMGTNPSYFEGSNLPVEQVTWKDAQAFILALNQKEKVNKYRLPTEAEWEYACRAGTTSEFSFSNDTSVLDRYGWSDDYGWCAINSNDTTHPVGQRKPNAWGLYDMHGNVWEWTQDLWHSGYEGAPEDGSTWEEGNTTMRVGRGGSWIDGPNICQSSFRGELDADTGVNVLGFRVVMDV